MTCPQAPELIRGRVEAWTPRWEPPFSQADLGKISSRGGGGWLSYLEWIAGLVWVSLSFPIFSRKHNSYPLSEPVSSGWGKG